MEQQANVREATENDLAQVLQLYAQPEIDDGVVLDLEHAKTLLARFAAYPDYKLYVALLEEKVVGSFALLIMDNLGHMGAKSGVMEDVVVDPTIHRKGVGKAMMSAAFEVCRAKGCYKLSLSANLKRDAAHSFYEAIGFERHGYSFLIPLEET
ncbi:GNAT family N-acetyltransferase [Denitrobaculum tricleocarpae]|uniref:GNAT family N-acetyltransferase n=1 Tax=Denitrobaculum tricleocarpae TaxID=2591009 RepID=A0A545TF63_9PROT|nr:GNAT family N-acetyltransferase [Denitrobaculum tricleocarpae]TQV75821.1 GNAT family N-acetyltransferase [Denitrobaculum tricleocarpae]